jgi:hypothetical protein
MADIEFMTDKERKRNERNKTIIKEFNKLNPEVMAKGYKPYRTICIIAEKHHMTPAGVRFVLKQTGTINTLREVAEEAKATAE